MKDAKAFVVPETRLSKKGEVLSGKWYLPRVSIWENFGGDARTRTTH